MYATKTNYLIMKNVFLLAFSCATLFLISCAENEIQLSAEAQSIENFQSQLLEKLSLESTEIFDLAVEVVSYEIIETATSPILRTEWNNGYISTSQAEDSKTNKKFWEGGFGNDDPLGGFRSTNKCVTTCTSDACSSNGGCDVQGNKCSICLFGDCTKTRSC